MEPFLPLPLLRRRSYQAQWLNVPVDFPLLQRIALPITIGAVRFPGIKFHERSRIRLLEVLLHGGNTIDRMLSYSAFDDLSPAQSPHGKWLAVEGATGLFLISVETGEKRLLWKSAPIYSLSRGAAGPSHQPSFHFLHPGARASGQLCR